MARHEAPDLPRALRERVITLKDEPRDFSALLERVGNARFVLIGEASHGTHEFYRMRAELTKKLIRERGFSLVAVEADWPEAYRVNRYVLGMGRDKDAVESLTEFKRFPGWMWRNADVLDFVGWLRAHNDSVGRYERKIGFYGIDLYSLHSSIKAVLDYLARTYPEEAERARERYACFDYFGEDPQTYGMATTLGQASSCEDEVVQQLVELQAKRTALLARHGLARSDALLFAEQNARVVKNAERYYRAMFRADTSSWNLRDRHMSDTVDALATHFEDRKDAVKLVVWAHNSHVGDALATDRALHGELNLGQLVREHHPGDTVLVGFSTYEGTVTAADAWEGAADRKRVRRALPGSREELFHQVGVPNFLLLSERARELAGLDDPWLHRAIGVIYRPDAERMSHYYYARLTMQFDAIIHLDRTRAVEPLERSARWQRGEFPETYPSGV
jgi:erythromycin esterase-like protein